MLCSKIMNTSFKNEIKLLNKMSYLAENGLTPNMPIVYKIFECEPDPTINTNTTNLLVNISSSSKSKSSTKGYYIVLNELANGDINDFLVINSPSKISDIYIYESIIIQVFFALRMFHKHTGHIHNDAHCGNFLYHKITKPSIHCYWHYRFNLTDIFVPNHGYLVVLWDPGIAKKFVYNNQTRLYPYIDFYRVFAIISHNFNYNQYVVLNPFDEILSYILENNKDPTAIMKYISEMAKTTNLFKTVVLNKKMLPKDAIILNDTPYIL